MFPLEGGIHGFQGPAQIRGRRDTEALRLETRLFTNLNAGVTIREWNGEDARITIYKWHIQDPVMFRKSLKVDVERRSYIAVTDPETGKTVNGDFKYKYKPSMYTSLVLQGEYLYNTRPAAENQPFTPFRNAAGAPERFSSGSLMLGSDEMIPAGP